MSSFKIRSFPTIITLELGFPSEKTRFFAFFFKLQFFKFNIDFFKVSKFEILSELVSFKVLSYRFIAFLSKIKL